MRDINRYVTRKYATDWKDIGLELGLSFGALSDIADHHRSNGRQIFEDMIWGWIEKKWTFTWKTLEILLTNVNRRKLDLDLVDDVYGMITLLI